MLALSLTAFAIDFVVARGLESGRLRRVDHLEAISDQLQSNSMVILFVAFPGACVTIFKTFPCLHLDDGTRWLSADLSINCDDPTHLQYVLYATLMLFVYPLGVPLLQTFLLRFKYREALEHMRTLDAIPKYQSSSERFVHKREQRPRPRLQSLTLGSTMVGTHKLPTIAVRRVPIGYAQLAKEAAAKKAPPPKATSTLPEETTSTKAVLLSPPPSPPPSPPSPGAHAANQMVAELEAKPATKQQAFLALPKPVRNLVKPYNSNAVRHAVSIS